jgi:hypothetical protein
LYLIPMIKYNIGEPQVFNNDSMVNSASRKSTSMSWFARILTGLQSVALGMGRK